MLRVPRWTLGDLMVVPLFLGVAMASLRGEDLSVIRLALAGSCLSVGLAITGKLVGRPAFRMLRWEKGERAKASQVEGPDAEPGYGRPKLSGAIARRKALAAAALAAILIPIWFAVENELLRSAAHGGWLLPPISAIVLFGIASRRYWQRWIETPSNRKSVA